MATAAQAIEDFCLAYRAMLAAARRVRMAVRAEAAGQAAPAPRRIDTQDIVTIQRVVAEHYGLTVDQLVSRRKPRRISEPRLMAIALCRSLTPHLEVTIAEAFCRERTLVIYAHRHALNLCESSANYLRTYTTVRNAATTALAAVHSQPAVFLPVS